MKVFGWLAICVGATAALGLLLLTGCTITPVKVHSSEASYDGPYRDSGAISSNKDGSGLISDQAKNRYNALVRSYGNRFTVPLHENDGLSAEPVVIDGRRAWTIDPEHFVKFQSMNRWRKQDQP
jgi:hypothetical protein